MEVSPDARTIIACARSWRGTRFAHQGRRKADSHGSGGVDCLGLLVGIARELHLKSRDGVPLAAQDALSYSKSPDGSVLKSRLEELLYPIAREEMRPGDVALFSLDGQPQHLAVLSDYAPDMLGMIHAYAPTRRVVEHRLDDFWRNRLVSVYRWA